MPSDRQTAANRLNAQKSTGPTTDVGKRRSRRNACKHGLTAESVVTVLEDEAAYRKFERIVLDDYRPETALERALVARVASLLWRLRRAVAIESGLFEIHGSIVREPRRERADAYDPIRPLKIFYDLLKNARSDSSDIPADRNADSKQTHVPMSVRDLAITFLRMGKYNLGALELVGRYETRLWRQLAQTILLLEFVWRVSGIRGYQRRSIRSGSLVPSHFDERKVP